MDLLSYSMDNVTGFPNTICWIVIYAVDIATKYLNKWGLDSVCS